MPKRQRRKFLGDNISRILLVTDYPELLADFISYLTGTPCVKLTQSTSMRKALELISRSEVDTVIVDENLANGLALPFVKQLTKVQPLINCAMISSLSLAEFHEATEGLGIFMQLPASPGSQHAEKMLQLLQSIEVLMAL